jgi:hypothetical protein
MPRIGTTIFILGTIALIASTKVHAQDSSDMARCAELENADARLACYDEVISGSISSQPDPEAAEKEPNPLTEEVGQEQLDSKDKPDQEPEAFAGRVTDCRQNADGKWYFYFANGQVWKESNSGRQRFKDCDFEATITKDAFGYKMQIDGEGKKIRIGRVR